MTGLTHIEARPEPDSIDTYARPRADKSRDFVEGRLLDILSYPDQHLDCVAYDCSSRVSGAAYHSLIEAHERIRKWRL